MNSNDITQLWNDTIEDIWKRQQSLIRIKTTTVILLLLAVSALFVRVNLLDTYSTASTVVLVLGTVLAVSSIVYFHITLVKQWIFSIVLLRWRGVAPKEARGAISLYAISTLAMTIAITLEITTIVYVVANGTPTSSFMLVSQLFAGVCIVAGVLSIIAINSMRRCEALPEIVRRGAAKIINALTVCFAGIVLVLGVVTISFIQITNGINKDLSYNEVALYTSDKFAFDNNYNSDNDTSNITGKAWIEWYGEPQGNHDVAALRAAEHNTTLHYIYVFSFLAMGVVIILSLRMIYRGWQIIGQSKFAELDSEAI